MVIWVEQICSAPVSQTGRSQLISPAIDRWECQNPSTKGRIAALNPKETL